MTCFSEESVCLKPMPGETVGAKPAAEVGKQEEGAAPHQMSQCLQEAALRQVKTAPSARLCSRLCLSRGKGTDNGSKVCVIPGKPILQGLNYAAGLLPSSCAACRQPKASGVCFLCMNGQMEWLSSSTFSSHFAQVVGHYNLIIKCQPRRTLFPTPFW